MTRVVAVALAVVALFPVGLVGLLGVASSGTCTGTRPETEALDSEQLLTARTVLTAGRQLAVPSRGLVVAVSTGLQESGLRNLTYGDRDSLGVFQQRPSQGWGSPAQLMDPAYASSRFFTALLAVPGWQVLPVAEAAQAVQRSAYPNAYTRWEPQAVRIVADLTGSPAGPGGPTVPATDPGCAPEGSSTGPVLSAGAARSALNFAAAQVGDAYVLGAEGPDVWDCSSLVRASLARTGVELPRTAAGQYDWFRARRALIPGPARLRWLRPGDLLFSVGASPDAAGDGEPVGHVALYAGAGIVIEAKGRASGVTSGRYSDSALSAITWVGRLPTLDAPATPRPAENKPARVAGSTLAERRFS